ncbi:MAG: hypothetical protein IJV05_11055 [Muribaculaceae bacterium]|nr:hypothetical protein [Muribaculaceae bacterium]
MNGQGFQDIGKRLPYSESDEYLDGLIERTTEGALRQRSASPVKRHWVLIASAAAALLVIGIGVKLLNHGSQSPTVTMQSSGPIDEFLNTLTDEEVAMLPYYEIEEIPEY